MKKMDERNVNYCSKARAIKTKINTECFPYLGNYANDMSL